MPFTLKYKVLNSQIVCLEVQMKTEDGEPYTAQFRRTSLEALALDLGGKTFSAVLPAEAATQIPEGSLITITVDVEEAPAESTSDQEA